MVQIAANSAVCHLNDGKASIKNVLNMMALDPGMHTMKGLEKSN